MKTAVAGALVALSAFAPATVKMATIEMATIEMATIEMATINTTTPKPAATLTPGQLTVGVSLPSAGFETGVARGTHVIYAQGFDIDLALDIAKRLDLAHVEFVQSRFGDLVSVGKKPWDIAVAQITITAARSRNVSFSRPYMTVDQGVLAAKALSPLPHSLAGLRPLQLCALRGSTGADVAKTRVAPEQTRTTARQRPHHDAGLAVRRLSGGYLRRTDSRRAQSAGPTYYGTFVGLVPTAEHYGIALPKGSPVDRPGRCRARRVDLERDGPTAREQVVVGRPGQGARAALTPGAPAQRDSRAS
jgi:ABC-type amino acid transport substrate-binding protein